MGKRYQHLVKQWNTWCVEKKIPEDVRQYFIHGEESPAKFKGKAKTRFTKSLETDDKDLAEILKKPILSKWEMEIRLARQKEGGSIVNPKSEALVLRELYQQMGATEEAAKEVGKVLFQSREQLGDDTRVRVYAQATGKSTKTSDYIDEWLSWQKYSPQVAAEAGKFVKDVFAKRFPTFENIDRQGLKVWAMDMMMGRNGYKANKRQTVAKKISYVTSYWKFCEDQYTDAINICTHDKVLPDVSRTKAATSESQNKSYIPFDTADCWRLYDAAQEDGYEHLADIIKLGMYTGCRIGELCHMKLEQVTDEWLQVADAKTYSGQREIPIHKDVQQLVERLKQTSTDGFLLSGLPSNNDFDDRSRGMSQKFGRLKSKLNFEKKRYAFHSFRSTILNRMENAGVNELFAARIAGHKIPTMSYGVYSGQIDWSNAVEAMAQVQYPR